MSTLSSRAQSLFQMIKMGAPNTQFQAWMHHVTGWYNALADDEKNEVLETLISQSGPHQMFMLCRKFPDLLYRDFISLLPPEVAVIILSYLDGDTLLTCCLVCKKWDDIISNIPSIWWHVARNNGVIVPPNSVAAEYNRQELSNTTDLDSDSKIKILPNESEAENSDKNIELKNSLNTDNYEKVEIQNDIDTEIASESRSVSIEIDKVNNILNEEGTKMDDNKGTKSDSRYIRALYRHSKLVIEGFKNGSTINIKEHYIDKGSWRVTSVKYHQGNVVTGCDDHTVQVWDVPSGDLLTSVSTHSVCCLTITDQHLYTASFNANAECWDLNTGLHSKTFCGHTSAVLAIDVSCDEHFLLTGSVDRTAKLWDLHKSGSEQLVKTFDDTHMDWVFQVKFLSMSPTLLFISADSMVCCVWRVSLEGRVMSSSHVVADRSTKFTSFYHSIDTTSYNSGISGHSYSYGKTAKTTDAPSSSFSSGIPSQSSTSHYSYNTLPAARYTADTLSACQWTEMAKASVFVQYSVDIELGQLKRIKSFRIWLDSIKAHLLGAGRRFAVIMCAISRRNFHVLDIHKETVVATIATPDFYVLTRNGSTVTLCDTSWLDGFDFKRMTNETPVFAASVALNRVMLGTWSDFVSCVGQKEPETSGELRGSDSCVDQIYSHQSI